MKYPTYMSILLAAGLVVTTPAFARHGADDANESSSHSSHSSNNSEDSSSSSNSANASKSKGVVKGAFSSSISSPVVKGKFKHTVKKKTEELSINIKVGKGDLVTNDNLDTAVIRAYFPDGEVCELETDDEMDSIKFYEYSLKLLTKKGVYREKDGSCDLDGASLTQIPEYASAPIVIEFDVDDDIDTPNVEIATGTFNP